MPAPIEGYGELAVTVDKLAAMRALWAAEPVHYEGTHASVPPS
ncbi:hypothetical protein P468_04063, partial [Mycobacterium tuberculosis TKK_03_0022]